MNEPIAQEEATKGKKRHWFLTTWLILMIVSSVATILIYLLMGDTFSYLPGWAIPVLIVFLLINLGSAIALFKWKKWAFWVLCGTSVVGFVVNLLTGVGIVTALSGLISVPILYGVLNIGKENKGWTQLE